MSEGLAQGPYVAARAGLCFIDCHVLTSEYFGISAIHQKQFIVLLYWNTSASQTEKISGYTGWMIRRLKMLK